MLGIRLLLHLVAESLGGTLQRESGIADDTQGIVGILIVEFANQKQQEGQDKLTAVREASKLRLRPILMTSAATVLGLIPLAFASGEGCNQRIAMGVAVVGGMLVSTVLTMYIVPSVCLTASALA